MSISGKRIVCFDHAINTWWIQRVRIFVTHNGRSLLRILCVKKGAIQVPLVPKPRHQRPHDLLEKYTSPTVFIKLYTVVASHVGQHWNCIATVVTKIVLFLIALSWSAASRCMIIRWEYGYVLVQLGKGILYGSPRGAMAVSEHDTSVWETIVAHDW